MEADLLRWFHVDLLDVGTVGLSWRRLGSLVACLPPESLVVAVASGERQWGPTEHLLASVVDAVEINTWMVAAVNSAGKRPQRPKPVPRPGVRSEAKRSRLSGHEMAARLRAQRAREVLRRGD